MEKLPGKVLIIDDDHDVLYTARLILKRHFAEVQAESSPKNVVSLLEKKSFDVIILDMNFSPGVTNGQEGLFWLRKILKADPRAHVMMNTAYGDVEIAVEAMKRGAIDFLIKPWKKEKLVASAKAIYKLSQTNKEVERLKSGRKELNREIDSHFPEMLSEAASMKPVFSAIKKVAITDANILILGENGTGKELVARAIHRQSSRREEPFIKVDLGAIAENLFESELFGHEKGAFTDAKEARAGRFEIASGGTLFLDEIGNLALPLQAKLLSALQNRQITRIGSNKMIPLNIRLICATNKPLFEMAAEGSFRQDLIYRINTVKIELPPLRERIEDISLIARHYLGFYAEKYQKSKMKLNKTAIRKLEHHNWPGNVRELMHAMERAVIMADSNQLTQHDFPLNQPIPSNNPRPKTLNLEEMEKHAIIQAIKSCNGNYTKAAKELGFGRSTLYRKMEKYGIE